MSLELQCEVWAEHNSTLGILREIEQQEVPRVGGGGLMYPQLEEQGEGPVEIILLIHLRVQRAQKNSVLRGGPGTRRAWDDTS